MRIQRGMLKKSLMRKKGEEKGKQGGLKTRERGNRSKETKGKGK